MWRDKPINSLIFRIGGPATQSNHAPPLYLVVTTQPVIAVTGTSPSGPVDTCEIVYVEPVVRYCGQVTTTNWTTRMKPIDLSHPISQEMPVYPGTEPPVIITGCTVAEDGFLEKKITLYSHTGTHVDAPAHLILNGKTLDAFPVDRFFGSALVLDASETDCGIIGAETLEPLLEDIARVDFALIRTGWSRYWGRDRYFSEYPILSIEAAETLAGLGLNGVGFDTISPDPVESTDLPIHRVLMAADMIIIENLTGLEVLPGGPISFSCFPLAFVNADGSPVRAVAYI